MSPAPRRSEARKELKVTRRIRKHVACLLTRNAGWSEANSYAEAMNPKLRPQIKHQDDDGFEAGLMAQIFGENLFDREAYKRLGVPTNGFDYSVGWNLDPKLPYLKKCTCRRRKASAGSRSRKSVPSVKAAAL